MANQGLGNSCGMSVGRIQATGKAKAAREWNVTKYVFAVKNVSITEGQASGAV